MAKPFKRRDSKFWWIKPVIDGIQDPQSTRTTDYQEALDMLRSQEGKIADGLITLQANRVTFREIAKLVERDYKANRQSSLPDAVRRFEKHILPAIGDLAAKSINGAVITEYKEKRLDEGARPNGIDRELALIKRAYTLARQNDIPLQTPAIKMFNEKNPRQGFFEEPQFRSALHHANELLQDFLIAGYYTGWRHRTILKLQWTNIDWHRMVVHHWEKKNKKPTVFPLEPFPELITALKRRQAATKGLITPWVFQRDGERAVSIRTAWETARIKAGIPGRLIHDLRRTAVRNLKTMGWSDTEIMEMCGLKTLSMLLWYGITVEHDILQKAKALAKAQAGNG